MKRRRCCICMCVCVSVCVCGTMDHIVYLGILDMVVRREQGQCELAAGRSSANVRGTAPDRISVLEGTFSRFHIAWLELKCTLLHSKICLFCRRR